MNAEHLSEKNVSEAKTFPEKQKEGEPPEHVIIEIGPGLIPFPAFVGARKLKAGDHYIGVDISLEDRKYASVLGKFGIMNSENKKNENTGVSFIAADAAGRLALEKGIADEVVAKNVLTDPTISRERAGAILQEMSRVAKTGGKIIFVETNTPSLELFQKAMKEKGLGLESLGFQLKRYRKYGDDAEAFSEYGSETPDRESFIAEFIKSEQEPSHE